MYFCKICGRQLEKKGDICINCYENLIEEEEKEQDNEVLFSFRAKYSLIYEIMKTPFTYLIILILIVIAIIAGFQTNLLTGFLTLVVYLGLFILYFLLNKIRIESRKIDLYRTRLIYTRKLHLKNYYEVRYKDVYEITFEEINRKTSFLTQTSWWLSKVNKKYRMTDLYFRLKKTDNSLFTPGFFIKPVQDFEKDIMPKIMEIMGFTKKDEERRSTIEELLNIKKKDKDKDKEINKEENSNVENDNINEEQNNENNDNN